MTTGIYVESWGRGISKMTELCVAEGLPKPTYLVEGSDFWVEFRKDIYHREYLQSLGLNERQVKAVLYAKKKGKITNKEYQELNQISKRTATTELTELAERYALFKREGTSSASQYPIPLKNKIYLP
ncbi:hypothetical protein [Pedobacter sp. BS3]|uniref:hypothetical protein n=1 Tax=Pedobacter sp. BS3 TaxID=2567937 RepID=UPI0016597EEE|nr:hypothetical protein [Pedobacter sp. BS3]